MKKKLETIWKKKLQKISRKEYAHAKHQSNLTLLLGILYIFFFSFPNYRQSGHLDTYLDHFLLCARNPTLPKDQTAMGQACMSKGGVPVQPYFVLGGFPGKEYREAQAAVMTILGKLAMLCSCI